MPPFLKTFIFNLLQTRIGLGLSILARSVLQFVVQTKTLAENLSFIWRSREFTNFTFNLSDESRAYLPHFISGLIQCRPEDADRVILELEHDQDLAEHYRAAILNAPRRWSSDAIMKPGKLLIHYALLRLTKPRYVVEAGMDKGLGALIMNRALRRNHAEGFAADYCGIEYRQDRPPFLIQTYPHKIGDIRFGLWAEKFATLPAESVDFLYYDALATDDEFAKLGRMIDRLSPNAIVVSSWMNPHLIKIAERTHRNLTIFPMRAKDHWAKDSELVILTKRNGTALAFQER